MDLSKAVSIIRKDLEEVSELLNELSLTPGAQIVEIELARSRVHSAVEMLKLLPKLNEGPAQQPAPVPEAASFVQTAPEVRAEVAAKKVVVRTVDEVKKEVVEIKAEMKEQNAAPQKGQETAKPILADKFTSSDTIGEKATSVKQDEVITSVIHSKPISDIGAAIGINDKFYFIRELFSGDSRAYQDTIRRLNTSTSLGEAMKILDDSTVMGSDPAAQSSFVDVVRRKFNINV